MDIAQSVYEMQAEIQIKLLDLDNEIARRVEKLFGPDVVGPIDNPAGLSGTVLNPDDRGERSSDHTIRELWRQKRSLEARLVALEKILKGLEDPKLVGQIQVQELYEALLRGDEP